MNSLELILDKFASTDNEERKGAEATLETQLQQNPQQLLFALASMIRSSTDAVLVEKCTNTESVAVWPPSCCVEWPLNHIQNTKDILFGVLWAKMQEHNANMNCSKRWDWNEMSLFVARWQTLLLNWPVQ
jgi:hypothetical protein